MSWESNIYLEILSQLQVQGYYPKSQSLWKHWGGDRDPSPLTLTPHQKGGDTSNQMTQTVTLNLMRASIWSRTMTQQQRIGRQKTCRNLYQWLSKGVWLIRRGKNLQENFQSHRQPKLQKQTHSLQISWGSVIQNNRTSSFPESKPRSLQPVPL